MLRKHRMSEGYAPEATTSPVPTQASPASNADQIRALGYSLSPQTLGYESDAHDLEATVAAITGGYEASPATLREAHDAGYQNQPYNLGYQNNFSGDAGYQNAPYDKSPATAAVEDVLLEAFPSHDAPKRRA